MPASVKGSACVLADRESVQLMLGDLAMRIEIGRLLVMKAAWALDRGERAQAEVSMAKILVANVLHDAADRAIQINGARGYSKDTRAGMDLSLCPAGAPRRRRRRGSPDGAQPAPDRKGA